MSNWAGRSGSTRRCYMATDSDEGKGRVPGKTVTIEQFRSANRRRTLPDTPAVRGMINRIRHLVRVVKEKP